MSQNYLTEALNKLKFLKEDVFPFDKNGAEDLDAFLDGDISDEDVIIYDADAETEDELKSSYIGKCVIRCNTCHALVYKDAGDIVIDEETDDVNVDEECPQCHMASGFKVIGQIDEFDEDTLDDINKDEESDETLDDNDIDFDDIEVKDIDSDDIDDDYTFDSEEDTEVKRKKDDELEEKFHSRKNVRTLMESKKSNKSTRRFIESEDKTYYYINHVKTEKGDFFQSMHEANATKEDISNVKDGKAVELNGVTYEVRNKPINSIRNHVKSDKVAPKSKAFTEDFSKVEVETDDDRLVMQSDKSGKISVESTPKDSEAPVEDDDFSLNDNETIVPVDAITKSDIEISQPTDSDESIDDLEMSDYDINDEGETEETEETEETSEVEETSEDGDEEELDLDEFSDEEFDELGESYLRECYSNVRSFKTTNATLSPNKIYIEGLITFKSGKQSKTRFVFESGVKRREGKYRFTGMNEQFAPNRKSFTLDCSVKGKKLVTESLTYKYNVQAETGLTEKVHGMVRSSKR